VPKAKRGDIWMADLGLAAKARPVLILSVDYREEERAVVTYVIQATSLRGTQYEVPHQARGMPAGAFGATGPRFSDILEWFEGLDRRQVETLLEFVARSLDRVPASRTRTTTRPITISKP
jgi:PemK-like, MazF-like toxin of type II toxin-antitoxin system